VPPHVLHEDKDGAAWTLIESGMRWMQISTLDIYIEWEHNKMRREKSITCWTPHVVSMATATRKIITWTVREWNPLGSDYYGIIGGSTARDDFTSRWEEFHKGFHGGAKCSLQEPRNNPCWVVFEEA
jgi:hypothetical protein